MKDTVNLSRQRLSTRLRAATAEDAPAVADVLLSSRGTFLPYAPLAHSDEDVRQWVAEVLIPSGGVTVACRDGAVLGILAVSEADGAGWIDQLYVAPAFVGRGLGSLLLECALSELPRPVRLYTFQANTAARRFYERHGFRAVAFTDGSSNEEQCPDVLYECALTDARR